MHVIVDDPERDGSRSTATQSIAALCAAAACADVSQILDLFVEESWRSVYAGQLEVRPPAAPTTPPSRSLIGHARLPIQS